MGDDRIDTVISHIDMGYLVTLGPSLRDCVVHNPAAKQGAGVLINDGSVTMLRCKVSHCDDGVLCSKGKLFLVGSSALSVGPILWVVPRTAYYLARLATGQKSIAYFGMIIYQIDHSPQLTD